MGQKEFSDYIIPRLLSHFPDFNNHCEFKSDGIVDIEYQSKRALLMLWVTTQDKEITVGFSGNPELRDFHMHMSQLGANTPEDELKEAIDLINNILNDQETIIHSNVLGYTLGEIDEIKKYKEPDEIIEFTVWSKL